MHHNFKLNTVHIYDKILIIYIIYLYISYSLKYIKYMIYHETIIYNRNSNIIL